MVKKLIRGNFVFVKTELDYIKERLEKALKPKTSEELKAEKQRKLRATVIIYDEKARKETIQEINEEYDKKIREAEEIEESNQAEECLQQDNVVTIPLFDSKNVDNYGIVGEPGFVCDVSICQPMEFEEKVSVKCGKPVEPTQLSKNNIENNSNLQTVLHKKESVGSSLPLMEVAGTTELELLNVVELTKQTPFNIKEVKLFNIEDFIKDDSTPDTTIDDIVEVEQEQKQEEGGFRLKRLKIDRPKRQKSIKKNGHIKHCILLNLERSKKSKVTLYKNLAAEVLKMAHGNKVSLLDRAYTIFSHLRHEYQNGRISLFEAKTIYSKLLGKHRNHILSMIKAGEGFFWDIITIKEEQFVVFYNLHKVLKKFGLEPYESGKSIFVSIEDALNPSIQHTRAILVFASLGKDTIFISRDKIAGITSVLRDTQLNYDKKIETIVERKFCEEDWVDEKGNSHKVRQLPNSYSNKKFTSRTSQAKKKELKDWAVNPDTGTNMFNKGESNSPVPPVSGKKMSNGKTNGSSKVLYSNSGSVNSIQSSIRRASKQVERRRLNGEVSGEVFVQIARKTYTNPKTGKQSPMSIVRPIYVNPDCKTKPMKKDAWYMANIKKSTLEAGRAVGILA